MCKRNNIITIDDQRCFRVIQDVLNLFGINSPPPERKGFFKDYMDDSKYFWFPMLYNNLEWVNTREDSDNTIITRPQDGSKNQKHYDDTVERERAGDITRIVFGRNEDQRFSFLGIFKFDFEASNHKTGVVFRRVSEEANIA
jgi:hypothetical protein